VGGPTRSSWAEPFPSLYARAPWLVRMRATAEIARALEKRGNAATKVVRL
jgi:hypothetical protein